MVSKELREFTGVVADIVPIPEMDRNYGAYRLSLDHFRLRCLKPIRRTSDVLSKMLSMLFDFV